VELNNLIEKNTATFSNEKNVDSSSHFK